MAKDSFSRKLSKTAEELCDKKYAQKNFNSGKVHSLIGMNGVKRR